MEYRRVKEKGGAYFFTLVTHKRQPILTSEQSITRLREAFKREQTKRPFKLSAIVILPDHLHCLWRLPEDDHDYSTRWNQIKRYYSIGFHTSSQSRKREKALWQRRFWEHRIRDKTDWQRHLDYIHYNPVKHGYVERAADWPYSSFSNWVDKGVYQPDWGVSSNVFDDFGFGE